MVSALTPHGGQPSTNKSTSNPILEAENANKVPLASPESPSDINEESLIGNLGGYIGLFVGVSVWQIPDIVPWVLIKLKITKS